MISFHFLDVGFSRTLVSLGKQSYFIFTAKYCCAISTLRDWPKEPKGLILVEVKANLSLKPKSSLPSCRAQGRVLNFNLETLFDWKVQKSQSPLNHINILNFMSLLYCRFDLFHDKPAWDISTRGDLGQKKVIFGPSNENQFSDRSHKLQDTHFQWHNFAFELIFLQNYATEIIQQDLNHLFYHLNRTSSWENNWFCSSRCVLDILNILRSASSWKSSVNKNWKLTNLLFKFKILQYIQLEFCAMVPIDNSLFFEKLVIQKSVTNICVVVLSVQFAN